MEKTEQTEYVRLEDMENNWRQFFLGDVSEKHAQNIHWFIQCFINFIAGKCQFVHEVTPQDVVGFCRSIQKKFSHSTVKRMIASLKSAFQAALPPGAKNFFGLVHLGRDKDAKPIHHCPFSEAELDRLFSEAEKQDPLLHSLVVTAACTGLRLGDVCHLRWDSVNLANGDRTLEVTTHKTGQEVVIPIFSQLRTVLENALAEKKDGDEFVFPVAPYLYKRKYSTLIRMCKKLCARTLFADEAQCKITDDKATIKTPAEVQEAIHSAQWSATKREKVERTYSLYETGMSYRAIGRETGFSRGQISMYLHEVEGITGTRIIRHPKQSATSITSLLRLTQQKRKVGRKSASLYSWHSFRTSFVVLAITNEVPLELVRRIVGHTTVDMTLEYFNPTSRIVAETARRNMSGSVLNGAPSTSPSEAEEQRFVESAQSQAPWFQSCTSSYHQTETDQSTSRLIPVPETSKPPTPPTPLNVIPEPIHAPLQQEELFYAQTQAE